MQTFFTRTKASFHIMIKHAFAVCACWYWIRAAVSQKCVEIALKSKKSVRRRWSLSIECNSQRQIKNKLTKNLINSRTTQTFYTFEERHFALTKMQRPWPATRASAPSLRLHNLDQIRGAGCTYLNIYYIFFHFLMRFIVRHVITKKHNFLL